MINTLSLHCIGIVKTNKEIDTFRYRVVMVKISVIKLDQIIKMIEQVDLINAYDGR